MNNSDMLLGGGIPNIGGPKIDPLEYPTKKCSKCGSITFVSKYVIKEIPGTMIGMGTDTVVYPLKVLACSECGHIIEEDVKMYKLEKDLENNALIQ